VKTGIPWDVPFSVNQRRFHIGFWYDYHYTYVCKSEAVETQINLSHFCLDEFEGFCY